MMVEFQIWSGWLLHLIQHNRYADHQHQFEFQIRNNRLSKDLNSRFGMIVFHTKSSVRHGSWMVRFEFQMRNDGCCAFDGPCRSSLNSSLNSRCGLMGCLTQGRTASKQFVSHV